MNKYEEAFCYIDAAIDAAIIEIDESSEVVNWSIDKKTLISNMGLFQELVKRATPMKPVAIEYCAFGISVGVCKCGIHVDSSQNYCDECGQALDWSETK